MHNGTPLWHRRRLASCRDLQSTAPGPLERGGAFPIPVAPPVRGARTLAESSRGRRRQERTGGRVQQGSVGIISIVDDYCIPSPLLFLRLTGHARASTDRAGPGLEHAARSTQARQRHPLRPSSLPRRPFRIRADRRASPALLAVYTQPRPHLASHSHTARCARQLPPPLVPPSLAASPARTAPHPHRTTPLPPPTPSRRRPASAVYTSTAHNPPLITLCPLSKSA
ncbi:hypothetical protein CALCODRAFT_374846 [Calocera cornea HHB12733]|uniref:Uncharacterized protein n=1 Tax=Calocera cornea HHB12733 TaxID=1353952 RepID=A0A165EF08_9BASI|nr:hypothetical protein CALCODRAFT_374846 [Calocera cornea HHB12733]